MRNRAIFSPTSSFNRKPVHLALLLTVALSACTTYGSDRTAGNLATGAAYGAAGGAYPKVTP